MGARGAHVLPRHAHRPRPVVGAAHVHECGTCHAQVVVFVAHAFIVHICPLVETGDRYRNMKEVS